MNTLRLSLRLLWRDWRGGELRVLAMALILAVASVSSVAFFADRIRQALSREAHQLLGADLVLSADQAWTTDELTAIQARGLRVANAMQFVSMAQTAPTAVQPARSLLVGVKAVSASYPLRGQLRVAPRLGAIDAAVANPIQRGEVWLDERACVALGLKVGDPLQLGALRLHVAAVLTQEPDRGMNFFNIAPRVMMHIDDVPATALIRPGSRVTYQLFAAGERADVDAYAAWKALLLQRGQRIETLDNARPEIRAALDRAQRFLGLAALLAAVLAAVAIALSVRQYTARHLDACAVMRCLGATQSRLLALHATALTLLGLLACSIGLLFGFVAQMAIAYGLSQWVSAVLPAPSAMPALQGLLIGMVLLLGFSLPPLMQLKGVPALRVIRREVGQLPASALHAWVLGALVLVGLLFWQAGDARLGAVVVGGFIFAAMLFFGAALFGLRVFSSAVSVRVLTALLVPLSVPAVSVRYALNQLRRHLRANAVQLACLALALMAMLLLTITRTDLLAAWRAAAPPDAPNRFLIGIQPEQRAPLQALFTAAQLPVPELAPMVRGRLIAINARPVSEADYVDERAKRLVEREFNLSYQTALPVGNRITAGQWYAPEHGTKEIAPEHGTKEIATEHGTKGVAPEHGTKGVAPEHGTKAEASVEAGLARTLGLKLGDRLTYSVAGVPVEVEITSLRTLRWESMRVNFFVLTPPWVLQQQPASYITSFRLAPTQASFAEQLVARFPNMTVVDLDASLRQVQVLFEQLAAAVQAVFGFALIAGLLVLYAALNASEASRRHQTAILRALGASAAQVRSTQRIEFFVMGLLAGVLAACGAACISALLAWRVFEIDPPWMPWIWFAGPLIGVLLFSLNAQLSIRSVLRVSPALVLRDES